MSTQPTNRKLTLMIGALGVVFGDIGTSPLYTIRTAFNSEIGITPNMDSVLGILSLIFWLLMILVTGKYVTFIMHADNRGEGGILPLHSLALSSTRSNALKRVFVILGLLGASLFYGDSVITPAISVLSAVEGLNVAAPAISHMIIPITLLILAALFIAQRIGTASIGQFFGPIMIIWFASIGALGLMQIIQEPRVLMAINPYYALSFIGNHMGVTFLIMGAVMLAITGAEAIYVDMGHFGRKPIQYAWYFIALPGLLLNYFGQGALILNDPTKVENPFFHMAPDWLSLPLVVLSAIATVIASQATISGAFSLTRQAIQLGYMPRMQITHTSEHEAGQIYIPAVNTMLMLVVVLLVLVFKSSDNFAAAYGISVLGTMSITTVLALQVTRKLWQWPIWLSLLVCAPILLLDLLLLSSNMIKIHEGGWITLMIAAIIFTIMITWLDGSKFLYQQITAATTPLREFVAMLGQRKPIRVPGTAIFPVRTLGDTPTALLCNYQHNHVVHERIIILHVATKSEPRVSKSERYIITHLGENVTVLESFYGFMELPSIPLLLKQCVEEKKLELEMADSTFIVSRIAIVPDRHIGLPKWQAALYKWLHVNSVRAHEFYRIPIAKVLEIGSQIRL